jgi:hypothetical protein
MKTSTKGAKKAKVARQSSPFASRFMKKAAPAGRNVRMRTVTKTHQGNDTDADRD